VQKIFRCAKCQRGMRVVGSTGLRKGVARVVLCPYCKTKNKVMWPKGDKFNVQRIATR
jgi:Zn finger protein HypA/HybF involved in hydrogenase expression